MGHFLGLAVNEGGLMGCCLCDTSGQTPIAADRLVLQLRSVGSGECAVGVLFRARPEERL